MQRRANPILTFSLCTALVVHLLGFSAVAWWYVATHPDPHLPPINRWKVLAEIPSIAHRHVTPPVPAAKRPQPPASKPPPPPPPIPKKEKPHDLPKPDLHPPVKDDSGEDDTHGTANRSTPGQKLMQAPTGLEQADLMRALATDKLLLDPNAFNPASAGELTGSSDPRAVPSSAGVRQPDFVAEADEAPSPDADPQQPTGGPPATNGPGNQPFPQKLAVKENHPAATGSTNPTPGAKPVATTDNKEPPRAVRGRLATAGDTDSPASQADGSFQFQAGRMVARNGLKVKYSQPRFGDASRRDLQSIVGTEAVFQVEVNADGSNNNVQLAKSSGSDFVDQDLKLCLYASSFAPEKDKDGHPKRTVWTIHILL